MLQDHEVAESRSVEHLDYKVLAPGGDYVKVTHVHKTVPMESFLFNTSNHSLRCAGKHLVISASHVPIPADQIRVGELVITELGVEPVVSVINTGEKREMYDLRVESDDHLYFTQGIASHNSTGICGAELFKFNTIDNYKSMIIAPLNEHISTLGDKMLEMQRASIFPPEYVRRNNRRNNKYYKESPRGGSLKFANVLTDPSKVRGNSCQSVCIDEAQDFDPEHLPEIAQIQKAFPNTRQTTFAGTSKGLDSCLEEQYNLGSMGVWHIKCSCKEKYHSLGDEKLIPKLMSVDGLRCPNNGHLLNPTQGEYVHASESRLALGRMSFHLPQVIVPEYASREGFADIWDAYKEYTPKKFKNEVWGLAVDTGVTELTKDDLMRCCTNKTFEQTQQDYLTGKTRYAYVFSGLDWGGSDHEVSYKSKASYTVHTIWGMRGDGIMDLIYARRYSGMHYQDIAGTIVEAHNKYKAFAMGTDQGGGMYYNAYMRDCGRIPTNRIIHFQYTDTKLMLDRIKHPEAHILSLHRTDSISALISDIKDQRLTWPRWDSSMGFVMDCLNVRRNITETNQGRNVMRYLKAASKADDFLMSANYGVMIKRIMTKENLIPNKQLMTEMRGIFGVEQSIGSHVDTGWMEGGYVGG